MIFAAIDIGSNAGRLLFSNVYEKKDEIVAEKATLVRIPLRLGEDVFENGFISKEKTANLVNTLKAFKLLIDVYNPTAYKAVATAAMREAENRDDILQMIYKETNIELQIINGIEEANYISGSKTISGIDRSATKMFIDVGGGSTEISFMCGNRVINSESFKIGTIRLLKDKVSVLEWERLKSWIKYNLKTGKNIIAIGTGGNINKIAKIYNKKADNFTSLDTIKYAHEHISSYSMQERVEILGLRPDRADVIVPAAKIFMNLMKYAKLNKIMVPKMGLPDGVVSQLYIKHKQNMGFLNLEI
ncbi:MAG: hypothetical protein A2X12_07990 [Bacteroidetes bacterium GWE2_29_8]|nr:MAG: hypothetical protein A2X12_07990 [Bacteroidetes bacterium GWE2_29_8]OFY16186.1 MAG: hypothetical protein A2X02_07230 [Bacteroidetes bacterium GWF2_29_10]